MTDIIWSHYRTAQASVNTLALINATANVLDNMKRLPLIVFCVLLLLYTLGIAFGNWVRGAAALVIENKGPDPIERGVAKFCHHQFSFSDLAPGDFVAFAHHTDCESGYELEIWYSSGARIRKNGGYVMYGDPGSVAVFVIKDGEIRYDKDRSGGDLFY
ncbi:MAG: hypothetical protein O7D27_01990 [Alphaproteobacteria bacterium]|nr:hypothetical protein [Alphaproteobacteria bacterium]MCZ6740910.1 hypothetical protein [Alphaproteobacteria bacterium]MCZ6813039.1 hypothetical protein [Alphaproteobacteria bacterium]